MRSYLSRKAGVASPLLTLLAILALLPNSFSQTSTVAVDYGKLPLSFEANQGQSDPQVKFLSRGNGYSLFLTDSGAVLSLSKGNRTHARGTSPTREYLRVLGHPGVGDLKTDVVRMQLVGAAKLTIVSGTDKLPGTANYFIGNDPSKWHAGVPTYARVRYGQVYPGVDLVYYGNQGQLEYDFVVAPQADAKTIRMRFAGADKLRLDAHGDLSVIAKNGEVAFHKPLVYQTIDGERKVVDGRFRLMARNQVAFAVGSYDRSRELVIDPTLSYSTYLGGDSGAVVSAIAVDPTGAAYITGSVASPKLPITPGALQGVWKGSANDNDNVFVTKLNPAGTAIVYETYLGGSGGYDSAASSQEGDLPGAIAVDSSGNAYVAGQTDSNDFPVPNAYQSTYKGYNSQVSNGFVSKINPSGTALVYSTYLGGSGQSGFGGDAVGGIAVDGSGAAYVTGGTYSKDFPISSKPLQGSNYAYSTQGSNAFIAKINPSGGALVYSTYLGGTGNGSAQNGQGSLGAGDAAAAIAVDSSGNAYVDGVTYSNDFPLAGTPFQNSNAAYENAVSNAFIAEINPSGTKLIYSTYLGGEGNLNANSGTGGDSAQGIALGVGGAIYVDGFASSLDFPVSSTAYQPKNLGGNNGCSFVARLDPANKGQTYGTYLCDSAGDFVLSGIAVDSEGDAYVAGAALSGSYPVSANAFQPTNYGTKLGVENGFLTELSPTLTKLVYSTFLGGSGYTIGCYQGVCDSLGDFALALALDPSGNLYVAGIAVSGDFPITAGAYQTSHYQPGASFFTKFDLAATGTTIETATALTSSAPSQKAGTAVTFTATVAAKTGKVVPTGSVEFSVDGDVTASVALSATDQASYSTSALTVGTHTIQATYSGSSEFLVSTGTVTQTITGIAATPSFNPAAGTYSSAQSVTITDATTGAVIYYTTNGSTPTTSSTKYTGAITVSTTETIKAIAVAGGYSNSAVASATYTIEKPAATPVFSPVAGTYAAAQSVTLTDATSGAVIYYTTNGTTPTTSSTKYTAAIPVSTTETIKAIAVATGYANSAVGSATYTIEKPAATPVFSQAAGTYAAAQSVTLTDATSSAVIYYTTNGTTPTTSSTKYTAAIPVSTTEMIKAIAVATGYANSAVGSATYTIEKPAATPVFSPVAGTYAAAQSVTLTDANSGAAIYYTTNGATPTTASTKYTAPIAVAATETIKAIAVATGYTSSAVATAAYTIK